MIRFTAQGLEVDRPLLKAVSQFASLDPFRPSLHGIWFGPLGLCASDGHTAVVVDGCDPNGYQPAEWSGFWSRQTIDGLIKDHIHLLSWNNRAHAKPPNLEHVLAAVPERRTGGGPIGLDARYLSRLEPLQRAIRAPGAELVGVCDPTDATRWALSGRPKEGKHPDPCAHRATVVIMPYAI